MNSSFYLTVPAESVFVKKANFFVAGLNQYLTPARPLGYPVIAQVEPANYCNLKCPLCLTSTVTKSRNPALLSFEAFQRFIDECGDYLLHLIFWNWGEPFLNPDLFRMIAYAKRKGIIVHTSTNGNVPLDEAQTEALVDSGLDSLVVAVDGATQETYEKYRIGGRLDVVLSNIQKIVRIRSRKGSASPIINMRFVVMRHNESEIPQARILAQKLGVDYFSLKSVICTLKEGANWISPTLPRILITGDMNIIRTHSNVNRFHLSVCGPGSALRWMPRER